jgi:ketosteroid isomerase-like protein
MEMTMTMPAHTASGSGNLEIVERLNRAWNARDLDGALSLLTEDCLFENTSPAPDGQVFMGKDAIRRIWTEIFETTGLHFATEEAFAVDDRAVVRWRYSWENRDGTVGTIRGVDLFRLEDGLIAEKRSYVKG